MKTNLQEELYRLTKEKIRLQTEADADHLQHLLHLKINKLTCRKDPYFPNLLLGRLICNVTFKIWKVKRLIVRQERIEEFMRKQTVKPIQNKNHL